MKIVYASILVGLVSTNLFAQTETTTKKSLGKYGVVELEIHKTVKGEVETVGLRLWYQNAAYTHIIDVGSIMLYDSIEANQFASDLMEASLLTGNGSSNTWSRKNYEIASSEKRKTIKISDKSSEYTYLTQGQAEKLAVQIKQVASALIKGY